MVLLVYVAIFAAIIWFFIVLPQRRLRAQQSKLLTALSAGDDIVTTGGIYGTVTEVEEADTVLIEIAEDTEIRIAKGAVARIITDTTPAGTEPADVPPTPETPAE